MTAMDWVCRGEPGKSNRSRTTLERISAQGAELVALAHAAPPGRGEMN